VSETLRGNLHFKTLNGQLKVFGGKEKLEAEDVFWIAKKV
jgi:hypothetical protein